MLIVKALSAMIAIQCCGLLPRCLAVFDLYVPPMAMQEVVKAFADSKKVYYVFNGTVNQYALSFRIAIPMEVKKLYFCWVNKAQRDMPYSIGFSVSNKLAMRRPQLNITSRGLVPRTASGFEVTLPCTGAASTEVWFDIQINITMYPNNVTALTISRKKLCSQGGSEGVRQSVGGLPADDFPLSEEPGLNRMRGNAGPLPGPGGGKKFPELLFTPPPSPHQGQSAESSPGSSGFNGRDLAIFLGATVASILLIAGIVLVYFWRTKAAAYSSATRKQQQQQSDGNGHRRQANRGAQGHRLIPPLPIHHGNTSQLPASLQPPLLQLSQGNLGRGPSLNFTVPVVETSSVGSSYTSCSLPSHQKGSPILERRLAADPRDIVQELQVPWERITLQCILMEGTFGRLYRGSMLIPAAGSGGATSGGEVQEVLIKTVTEPGGQSQLPDFLQSGTLLAGLQHLNLNPLVAAAVIPGDPRPHLVYPYAAEGNLKMYLIRCRSAQSVSAYCVLSTQQLIHMAVQISKGLAHLHRRRIVHKDLACRNCLLTSDYTVKISDPALAIEFFPDDYQCAGTDPDPRPIKWLAIEALAERKFSPASDVWAFGVTLWELITRCLQPFHQTEPAELLRCLLDGYRLTKPTNCPDQLFSIMSSCWQSHPDHRPKLASLQTSLSKFHDTLSAYV